MKIFTYLFTVFGAILMLFATVFAYPWYISQIDSGMLMLFWFMGVVGILFIHHRPDIAEKLFRISPIGHSLIILLYAIVKFEYIGQAYFLILLLIVSYICFLYSSYLLRKINKTPKDSLEEKTEIKNFTFFASLIALAATILYFPTAKPFAAEFTTPYLFLFTLSPIITIIALTVYRKNKLLVSFLIFVSFLEIFVWMFVNPVKDMGIMYDTGLFLLARASLAFIAGISVLLSIQKKQVQ
ncbi:hypothetical protein ACFL22_00675 [Patescibacteria group bacterium]